MNDDDDIQPSEAERQRILLGREQEKSDTQWLMADPRGRRAMARIIGFCDVMGASFHPDNAKIADFREGQRHVGRSLMAQVKDAAPKDFKTMMENFYA